MLIQCTKKLLDQLRIKPEPLPYEGEPFFSWHANLITINRRKAVVVVNDQNRYVIVLYGLKAKDFMRLGDLIVQGIRETLIQEGIKEEVVEKYLHDFTAVQFSKTKDRTMVARMNKACDEVHFYSRYLDNESIFSTDLSIQVSRNLVGDGSKNYFYPNVEMYRDLENFAGESVFNMDAVILKVTLKLENHNVWRRIVVPMNRTFNELHQILQHVFGWRDYHLHEFYIYDDHTSRNDLFNSFSHPAWQNPIMNLVCDKEAFAYQNEVQMKLETGIKLAEYIPAYKMLSYHYDFGDNWQHIIEVEEIIHSHPVKHPVCLEGEGDAPPEDVGGAYGFEEFLHIIDNPKHSEYKRMHQWGKMQGYKKFDIEIVNRILKFR